MTNLFVFHGRLVKDVELKQNVNGTNMAWTSIAVKREVKDKTTGEYDSDFFDITAYGKTAELLAKYFSKGKEIIVNGRVSQRKYVDSKTNATRYAIAFTATNIDFCGTKDSANENSTNSYSIKENEGAKQLDKEINDDNLPF